MASTIHAELGFDKDDFNNKFLLIGEQNICDSSFLISSLIWQGLYKTDNDTPGNICMLSLHNSQEHYENIAIKLGYNINNFIKKGNLKFFDGFKVLDKFLLDENDSKLNTSKNLPEEILKDLFFMLSGCVDSFLKENTNHTYVIIDDLSDLLTAGCSLKSVITFVSYLRTLSSLNGFTLIIGTHFYVNDNEQCVLYKNLYRAADYCVLVSGLKTGFSSDVSGSINIVRKNNNPIMGVKEAVEDFYHFKLFDRQIKIFSPGTIQ